MINLIIKYPLFNVYFDDFFFLLRFNGIFHYSYQKNHNFIFSRK